MERGASFGSAQTGAVGTVIGVRTVVSLDSACGLRVLEAGRTPVTQPTSSEQTVRFEWLFSLAEKGGKGIQMRMSGINKGPGVKSVWPNVCDRKCPAPQSG